MRSEPTSPETLLNRLEEAARGLLVPSETDEPLSLFRYDGGAPSAEAVLASRGYAPHTPAETVSVDEFFAPILESDDSGFQALVDLLRRELSDLRVYRIGRVDIDVYVIGRHASGAWLGLRTRVVET